MTGFNHRQIHNILTGHHVDRQLLTAINTRFGELGQDGTKFKSHQQEIHELFTTMVEAHIQLCHRTIEEFDPHQAFKVLYSGESLGLPVIKSVLQHDREHIKVATNQALFFHHRLASPIMIGGVIYQNQQMAVRKTYRQSTLMLDQPQTQFKPRRQLTLFRMIDYGAGS